MAKMDFPVTPSVGTKYPQPPVAGQGTYVWDGEKWTSVIVAAPNPAPFDAMAYSGMQINGGMEVSQEKGTGGTTTNAYVIDGWRIEKAGTSAFNAAQYIASPFSPKGITASLGVGIATAQASLGGSDYLMLVQPIEGYRMSRLAWGGVNAQPLTVAFWSAHVKTGIYSVVVKNVSNNRSCTATYTQDVTGVAEYKTVTFPGDTAGTWAIDNTCGIQLIFNFGCGATLTAPTTNTWYGANYIAAPGQVNALDSTSNVFRLAGVTVLPGTQGPSATQSPNVMRPYGQELDICRRYWRKIGSTANNDAYFGGYGTAGVSSTWTLPFNPPMRANPTMAFTGAWTSSNVNSVTLYPGQFSFGLGIIPAALGGFVLASTTSGMYITADARL